MDYNWFCNIKTKLLHYNANYRSRRLVVLLSMVNKVFLATINHESIIGNQLMVKYETTSSAVCNN